MKLSTIKRKAKKPCEKYRVKALHLFGSTARGEDKHGSDLDFVVDFEDFETTGSAARYFSLLHDLEDTFGTNVDLLTTGALKKKSLFRNIEKDKIQIYG